MALHSHEFVETYTGLVGYGLDRPTDEATVAVYLQKLSDDALLTTLLPRLEPGELDQVFDLISTLLRSHLSEEEYHALFLKDPESHQHAPVED